MKILMVLLGVAAIASWVLLRKQRGPAAGIVITLLCLAAVGLAIGSIIRGSKPVETLMPRDFESAAAYKVGEAISTALPDGGTILVLNYPDITVNAANLGAAYLEGLEMGVKDRAEIVLAQKNWARDAFISRIGEEGSKPLSAVVTDMLNAQETAPDALVSFLGVPQTQDTKDWPPVYAIDSALNPGSAAMLKSGALQGLVVIRQDSNWDAVVDPGMTPEQAFDIRYEYLNPSTFKTR